MISTRLIEQSPLSVHFPCMMRSTLTPGLVVLFTAPAVGTVLTVEPGSDEETVGYHSTSWNENLFTPFEGELSLINEADDGEYGQESFLCDGDCDNCDCDAEVGDPVPTTEPAGRTTCANCTCDTSPIQPCPETAKTQRDDMLARIFKDIMAAGGTLERSRA